MAYDAARGLPPWAAVSQHTQRWLNAGVFEAIAGGVRALLRLAQGQQRACGSGDAGQPADLVVTPVDAPDRARVGRLALAVQDITGSHIEVAFVDQGDTGDEPAQAAQAQGMRLQVVTLPEAKRGVVLLSRRWVVERHFAWTTRFRCLARDAERWPETLAGLHLLAFAVLMRHRFPLVLAHSL